MNKRPNLGINRDSEDFSSIEIALILEPKILSQQDTYRPRAKNEKVWQHKPADFSYEIEVILPINGSTVNAFSGVVNPALWILWTLATDNDAVPLGYYFDFTPEPVPYNFNKPNSKRTLYFVKNLRLFFGAKKKSDVVKFKLGKLGKRAKKKALPITRKDNHSFAARGGRMMAVNFVQNYDEGKTMSKKTNKKKSSKKTGKKATTRKSTRYEAGSKKVPEKLKKTPRSKATKQYVFPVRKSYPIGDLYHARAAVLRCMWPTNLKNAKHVLQAVVARYPQYDWESYWNKERKEAKNSKEIKTFRSTIR